MQGKQSRLIVNGSISENDPNILKIELNIGRAYYCYVITTSSGTYIYTGTIEGKFSGGKYYIMYFENSLLSLLYTSIQHNLLLAQKPTNADNT